MYGYKQHERHDVIDSEAGYFIKKKGEYSYWTGKVWTKLRSRAKLFTIRDEADKQIEAWENG